MITIALCIRTIVKFVFWKMDVTPMQIVPNENRAMGDLPPSEGLSFPAIPSSDRQELETSRHRSRVSKWRIWTPADPSVRGTRKTKTTNRRSSGYRWRDKVHRFLKTVLQSSHSLLTSPQFVCLDYQAKTLRFYLRYVMLKILKVHKMNYIDLFKIKN